MEKSEITDRLTTIFRKTFSEDSLVLSDELTANDIDHWDSLTHMILISEIEKDLNIVFKLKELNKMKNVGALIEIITTKIN
ncbi:acyl carrier protein [Xanthomarina sp.]|uniref:acyl carrier protein n=1 Tax=Xanthomarina sp. TaxID=1931211 RepID=UPI002D04E044|nr:acyl carrier protein [Xanthomarina sp.]HLV39407.1 acyl carrier protein [Xanthomarina sp.]